MASTSRQRKPIPLGATGMARRTMAEHDAQVRMAQQESTLRETGTRQLGGEKDGERKG